MASSATATITVEEGPDTVTTPKFEWNFGNSGGNPEWVEELKWRDSNGTLGANISAHGGGGCGDPTEFWGQSYGNADSHGPGPVVAGNRGIWTARSSRTAEIDSAAPTLCSGDNPSVPVQTRYTFFDQEPQSNMVRIERHWSFPGDEITSNPAQGMRAYVPRSPDGVYNQEIYPNGEGNLVTDPVRDTTPITDWNQTWMAVNSSSTNAGYVILRDPADTMPAQLVEDYDSFSGSNNSGITLNRPAEGWVAPVTETEYLCFYDEASWPPASRSATSLPPGCESRSVPINTALPALSAGAGNPRLGEGFTATPGTWENTTGVFGLQWSRCDESSCEQISGATGTTYTATAADVGKSLKVTVTATAPGGETDTADSTVAGFISGHVYEGEATPADVAKGAPVQVCRTIGSPCRSTTTDSSGAYRVQVPVSGKYTVTAYPPAGSKALSRTRETVARVRPEEETTGQDVILPLPQAPPASVGFGGPGVRGSTSEGTPIFYWQEPFVIEYKTEIEDEVEAKVDFPDGSGFRVPADQPVEPSAEDPEIGNFRMRIPALYPHHGACQITIIDRHPQSMTEREDEEEEKEAEEEQEEEEEKEAEEEEDEEEEEETNPKEKESEGEKNHEKERQEEEEEKEHEKEEREKEGPKEHGPKETTFPGYIDPSGVVIRTPDGAPIAGATVTLFQGASSGGPFTQVPDGSAVMSPMNRANPDHSEADGHFGWDVIAGLYKVRAEKAGCHAPGNPGQAFVETGVQTIPPPVKDLVLELECAETFVVCSCSPPPLRLRASLSLPASGGTVKVKKSGAFTVGSAKVGCPTGSSAACSAIVAVTAAAPAKKKGGKGARGSGLGKSAPLKLGTSTLTVAPGATTTLSGKLSAAGLRKLKALKRAKATIAVTADVPNGDRSSGTLGVTLLPPPAPRR